MESPKEKLKRMAASEVDPKLTEADLDGILEVAAKADSDGLAPDATGWEPTYDLNAAAAAAWLVKAAQASELTEVEPGSGLITSKVFDNCRAMARIYSAKRNTSLSMR